MWLSTWCGLPVECNLDVLLIGLLRHDGECKRWYHDIQYQQGFNRFVGARCLVENGDGTLVASGGSSFLSTSENSFRV